MAREITHEANGPRIVDEDDIGEKGDIAICMCGLSADYPFCDGSHRATTDEGDDLYKYEGDDDENPRHVVEEIVFEDE
ncbi:CDGSH iron-sulfur domain-containing protein [Haloarculaceae archaeon H-GB2-1]|nr:CDGSH iron-sulfur domain-containing protein [Haloarculaceae archaeon H-GB1-1]MEA5407870.1 CDGSH iron-sulfur domain-containing protein [Haloarculaceae archaeon H-GB2-1]